ncbi:MAG: NUDIX domain-containing protein [Candidatus Scatovivens sp.]
MSEKNEIVDIYDENRNKAGKIINRKDKNKLNENEYTISVHCWIINSKKEILITQRSMDLNRGGMWEDTHGGVQSGETSIEAMKRELKEELGIDVENSDLKLIKTMKKDRTLRDCYIIYKDISLDAINFNDNEVMDCKYVNLEELKEIIKSGECTFSDLSQTVFNDIDINSF